MHLTMETCFVRIKLIGSSLYIIVLLIKLFRIGPVTGPMPAVLVRGRRPRANTGHTADRGPETGPIRK